MRLRTQYTLCSYGVGVVVALALMVVLTERGTSMALASLAAAGAFVLAGRALGPYVFGALLNRRIRDAYEREDHVAFRALASEVQTMFGGAPAMAERMHLLQAEMLLLEERFAEALPLLERLELGRFPRAERSVLLNTLAYCVAHAGDAERGVSLAREALASGATLPATMRAMLVGTLGIALVLAGHFAEGLAELERATGVGGTPRAQAIRGYYRGEALRRLGRADEARAAYEAVRRARPGSRWAERAELGLAALEQGPYRA